MTGHPYFEIIRPVNAVVAGLAGILAVIIATGSLPISVLFVFFIVFLITGAGNVINDYYDAAIDAVNRPERPIPSGRISVKNAFYYALFMFVLGNLISVGYFLISGTSMLLIISVVNSIILWLYAIMLKQTPIFGNITVSYLSASIFLFGGALSGLDGVLLTFPIACATFFAMIAREIIKDVEDMPGDEVAGAKTFPIVFGMKPALLFAFTMCIIGVLTSLLLYSRWGIVYLAFIVIVDIILLVSAALPLKCRNFEEVKVTKSTYYLKYGMFASLVVFLLSAIFL